MTDALERTPPFSPHAGRAPNPAVTAAVEQFGESLARKLTGVGGAEHQLRGPMESLLTRLGVCLGLNITAFDEVELKGARVRPDYAVDVGRSRIGYVELKAPGRGIPGAAGWRPSKRERDQFRKLAAKPNVMYTDGLTWGRFVYGEPVGSTVRLTGGLDDPAGPLRPADRAFETLIRDFLTWAPTRPRSLPELIGIIAGLCRLLREEVQTVLAGPSEHAAHEHLTLLAGDWRRLLFPGLDDEGFADAYAQTIAYALLLARLDGIGFEETSLNEIARKLGKKHSLIGRALAVLTDSDVTEELPTITTLRQVIAPVDWNKLDHGRTDVYSELYERFLADYDPKLRKKSGSYYTPQPVAGAMVDFVDKVLRTRMGRGWGIASDDVTVVDPAMGTGTFLVEVIRSVAGTIDAKQGTGARPDRLRDLFAERLVGFEIQVAPYAIAELRLHQALKNRFDTEIPATEVRFLTDALEDPTATQEWISAAYRPIERSRQEANRIKREQPVMVVIGNPPHVENTRGTAEWIERRRDPLHQPPQVQSRPSLDEFRTDGNARYTSDLHGLPWLYWRWAIWKVFEAHPDSPAGAIAFITPASLIDGKAFEGVREYLRRVCDEGWLIDLSPEGNRPEAGTRVFGPGVGRRLCIAVFARYGPSQPDTPADVHHIRLHGAAREKIASLRSLDPHGPEWDSAPMQRRAGFQPSARRAWLDHPALGQLMPWRTRGVTTGRAWVYAPHQDVLQRRWENLLSAEGEARRVRFKEGRDRKVDRPEAPLPGFPPLTHTIADEDSAMAPPIRAAYRSFDRQWVIPDNRLIEMPRPPLWSTRSDQQVYVSTQDSHPIESGPGLVFTSLIPDLDHFNVRAGGVHPLYRDADAMSPNMTPGLLKRLSNRLGIAVSAGDVLAYIAAVVAHPGYTRRFRADLRTPGIRVPLTGRSQLWAEAVEVGRRVLWLHTFGERFVDPAADRPEGALAIAERAGVRVLQPIRRVPAEVPERPREGEQVLRVGEGAIDRVSPAVYDFDVGGMAVVRHWFGYRVRDPRAKKRTSPLDSINVTHWDSRLTDDLLGLLGVVTECVALAPLQDDLLERICDGPTIAGTELPDPASAASAPPKARNGPSPLFE
ncbi:type ISP restriction/modification enzyme [Nocardiopsis halophila]|uniref:type ISP restriction/modification enzyme n=1 Tax=Nocardiopsis halophila TaxID=141692 RepID=UPI00034D4FF8|nr:type ISP restriction/modification enzyme [Nocardiopsis halophila]